MKFTESSVRRAKPRARKYEIADSRTPGLALRVLPSGKRAYVARFRVDGRDRRARLGVPGELTLEQARARATLLFSGARRPEERGRGRDRDVRFETLARKYLEVHVPGLARATQHNLRVSVRELVERFGARLVTDIGHEDVTAYHRSMQERPSAANARLQTLTHMYRLGKRWGLVPRDATVPTEGVRRNPQARHERFLTPPERRRLDRVIDEALAVTDYRKGALSWWFAATFRLLALSGMRSSEVRALEWSMVDWDAMSIVLPQSKTGRSIRPMSPQLRDFLRGLERERRTPRVPFVVYNRDGRPVGRAALSYAWGRTRRRAGLDDVRLHDLRHSVASDALMAGVPLALVGKILGHSTLRTTERYAHIGNQVVLEATARMGEAIELATRSGKRRRG